MLLHVLQPLTTSYRWGEVEWQHTLDKARLSADVAAAVLLVNEVRSLSGDRLQAWSWQSHVTHDVISLVTWRHIASHVTSHVTRIHMSHVTWHHIASHVMSSDVELTEWWFEDQNWVRIFLNANSRDLTGSNLLFNIDFLNAVCIIWIPQ